MTKRNETGSYTNDTRARISRRDPRLSRFSVSLFSALLLALWPAQGQAYQPGPPSEQPSSLHDSPSSPAVTDLCLPLLKSIQYSIPNTVTKPDQRPAGITAARLSALSLVFGVRFALGPAVDTGPKGRTEVVCRK